MEVKGGQWKLMKSVWGMRKHLVLSYSLSLSVTIWVVLEHAGALFLLGHWGPLLISIKGGARLNVYAESHADFQLGCSHALHPCPRAGKCLSAGSVLTLEIPSQAVDVCIVLCMLVCCANSRLWVQGHPWSLGTKLLEFLWHVFASNTWA